MDRIALALVTLGLATILAVVTTVIGGAVQGEAAGLAALAAAAAGLSIIAGLALLERRAFSRPGARQAFSG